MTTPPEVDAAPTWVARLPWVLLAFTVVCVSAMVPLSLGNEELFDTIFYGLLALTLGTTGAFVASRQPKNPIGWVFCAQGMWGGLLEMWGEGFAYHGVPTSVVGAWIIGWSWTLDLAAYALVFLLFPTGRLLSKRWRWVLWLLVAALVVVVPGQGLSAANDENPLPVDSPVIETMRSVGTILLIAGIAGAVSSLVIRFRRAKGLERLQLKQLVFAAAVILPIMGIAIPFYYVSVLVELAVAVSFLALPVAVGLAILRYRLYDIDVVVNRTLVYGALTATLAAVYLGSVLLLQLALNPFTDGSSLAIAISTLAVAALFRPARARIQDIVDRRFFRTKYDAAMTLEHFSARMRDQVDLSDIGADLLAVVSETVRPTHVSLWLQESGR